MSRFHLHCLVPSILFICYVGIEKYISNTWFTKLPCRSLPLLEHTLSYLPICFDGACINDRQEHVILEQSLRDEAALLKAAKDDLSRRAEHQEAELIDLQVRVRVHVDV